MKHFKYIILGGGTTAGYAAEEFVEQGIDKEELAIVTAESILPMNRPPMSKGFMTDDAGMDEILINTKKFYQEHGIEVYLETCAKSVSFGAKRVELDNGDSLEYEKLLIALGSKLIKLSLPGSDLKNIFYLRNLPQAKKIREAADKAQKAIVVGGQYIGTEMAASLNQMGLEVTMVFPEDRLLSKFATVDVAAFFQNYFREKGVELIKKDEVIKFIGDNNIEKVELKSGKVLETDMVVAGVGVEPNVKLFEDSGLNISTGIVVNEFCETNVPDVYAAGDIAQFPDLIFDKIRHVEHWENAFEQGKHAAKVMTGKREPYIFLPYFFSDVFDLSYEYFGDNHTTDKTYNRGSLEEGDFSTWYFEKNWLVAAFIMGSRPDEEREAAGSWIRNKTLIEDPRRIENANNSINDIPKITKQ
ncbi:MAG: NAD(P)/FAD-dependent oxidoreductase [Bacteroidales bacterium]|nr:NAD(P)/FAD-dependent oxidoreductase [Bacteroidales bacterium]MCF8343812.1 NAD(P)/FAD-dependent oxidoreductase [Bacteroidales bacterium]MCF8350090.1 NAD(P)/FAD-dependent oxidoreductase [Bacteroidales bacterium]MCF8374966.1 NAD(P)/FAD-dependent oxidoreductase [Bacteroidales bacterium]